MIKGVQTRVDSQIHPVALIENAEAIQAALMHMIDAVLKGAIDVKRANVVLKALHIAVRNSRNVYFHIRRDDMVREVPNFAEQYLTEHPELGPPITHVAPDAPAREAEQYLTEHPELGPPITHVAPNGPVRGAEQSSAEDCHPEEAKAFAKRGPANEELADEEPAPSLSRGHLHPPADEPGPPKKACHPEGARKRDSKDPETANRGEAASGNSSNPPEGNRKKATSDNTPPLTNRQSELNQELKKLEACIEGAMRGNWRDLRTVFNAIGLTPRKPPTSQKSPPRKKIV
jgi:hypothetical protein